MSPRNERRSEGENPMNLEQVMVWLISRHFREAVEHWGSESHAQESIAQVVQQVIATAVAQYKATAQPLTIKEIVVMFNLAWEVELNYLNLAYKPFCQNCQCNKREDEVCVLSLLAQLAAPI